MSSCVHHAFELSQEMISRHDNFVCKEYMNSWGMSMLGVCVRGRLICSIADLSQIAHFYEQAGLVEVSRNVNESSALAESPISDWLSNFDVEENGGRGWLTGLLLGYPLWTTVARYHTGAVDGFKDEPVAINQKQ